MDLPGSYCSEHLGILLVPWFCLWTVTSGQSLFAKDHKRKKDRKPLLDLPWWPPPPSPPSIREDRRALSGWPAAWTDPLCVSTPGKYLWLVLVAPDHLLRWPAEERVRGFPQGKETKNELVKSLSNWIQWLSPQTSETENNELCFATSIFWILETSAKSFSLIGPLDFWLLVS